MATRKRAVRKQVHSNPRGGVDDWKRRATEYAQQDTPAQVSLDGGFLHLAVWAIGRFGIGVVFLYMVYILYQDQRMDNQATTKMLYDTIQKTNVALYELKRVIEERDYKN